MTVDGFGFVFGTIALMWLAGLILVIWALVDCLQVKEDSRYQSGTKLVWVLIIIFLWGLGAIIYLAIGRPKPGLGMTSRGDGPAGAPGNHGQMPPPPPGSLD